MLIVFLFLVLIFSVWLTINPNNLRKFYFSISEKHQIKPPSLQKGSYKISPVLPSISFSMSIFETFFSGSTWWIFLFFSSGHFALYTNKWQSRISGNCICCLDNWINKANSDQKQNILDFKGGKIIFSFKCLIIGRMILWKLCLGKVWFSGHRPKCSPPIRLQGFLNSNISKTIWGTMFIFRIHGSFN